MIEVYYLSNNNSGRKAMKWLEDHNLKFGERKITKKNPIQVHEFKQMLAHSENGFDDLIKTRRKKVKKAEINPNNCSTEDLINVLVQNPSFIKLPIIIDEKKLVVGFNEKKIRCFLSKEYRHMQLLNSVGDFLKEI